MQAGIKLAAIVQQLTTGNAAATFVNMFQGRCTFAAVCFSTTGVYGWLHGKDLTSYALFVTAVQGLLVLHSWKEDVAEQRQIRNGLNPPAPTPPAASNESGTPQ